jgi:RNA polymerase sigma-70 factor, ECF subfamily
VSDDASIGAGDAALVAQTLRGDSMAYASLMRRHFDAAFAAARRLTGSAEDAEDACQEAFARAYFRLAECRDPDRFRGWVLQVVRHHAHNVRRYQALREATSIDDIPEPAAEHAGADDLERTELRGRLQHALEALPPVKRAVVRHHDVDGWTHPQVARALGISVLMSRRHLSDARAALRELLGDLMNEDIDND